jgi:asparagine synthase (glutamine-hydrolysing)
LFVRGKWGQFVRESRAFRKLQNLPYGLQLRLIANELFPTAVADRLRRLTGRTVNRPAFLDLNRLGAEPLSPHRGSRNLSEPVRSLSTAQLTSLNLPLLLHWADRDSMAHGVETRLPFLDHRLVEFCLGLPEEFKLADGWTKRVLREGLRNRLPESVRLRRDKLGFATAEEVWMRERCRETFVRLLDEGIASAQGILTADARAKAQRILDGHEPFSFLVWRMISFGHWLRRFEVKP